MKRNQYIKKGIHHSAVLFLLFCSFASVIFISSCTNNPSVNVADKAGDPPLNDHPNSGNPTTSPDAHFDLTAPKSHSESSIYDGYFKVVAPDSMQKDIAYEFRVEMIKDSITNSDFFNEVVDSNHNITIEDVELGRYMSVELVDLDPDPENNNFFIKRLSSEIQPIEDDDVTSWLWAITPEKSGTHTLMVIAKIKVFDEKTQKYRNRKDLKIKRKKIHVTVKKENTRRTINKSNIEPIIEGNKQSVNSYYWVLALFPILGLIIWFANRKRTGKEMEEEQEQKEINLIPLKEFNEFQSNFQELIAKDRIDKSFTALKDLLQKYEDEKLEKELVLLESNYQNNITRHNSNLIDNEDFTMNRSKVVNELIAMADRLRREE